VTANYLITAAAACLFAAAADATPRTVASYSDRALPPSIGKYAKDITWPSRETLIIATEQGVYGLRVGSGLPVEIIKGLAVPDGLLDPTALSSDGQSVSAISWNSNAGFSLRLTDHKRLVAQRSFRLIPMDVAVFGSRACVVGFTPKPSSEADQDAALWCGSTSAAWGELTPMHHLHNDHALSLFREAQGPFGGRIAIESDGTIDVITSVQPGVFRYSGDGKLKEVLGRSVDNLVIESMQEMRTVFASDLDHRYRLLLNTQPIIDDLVVTASGPAILVRLADGDKIHWELWYPLRSGGIGARVRLGIERIGPYGHLRCDVRGADLACVGSQPPVNEAALAKTAQAWPHLWLFHLPPQSQGAQ